MHSIKIKHYFSSTQSIKPLPWNIIYVMDIIIGLFITVSLYDIYGYIISSNIRLIILLLQIIPTLCQRIRLHLIIEPRCYYLGLLILIIMEYYTLNFRSDLNICYPAYIIIFYLNEDIREIILYHLVRICVKICIIIEHNKPNAVSNLIRVILEGLFIHRKHFKQYNMMEMSMIGSIKFINHYIKYGCHIKMCTIINRHRAIRELTPREQLIKKYESEATAIINRDGTLNRYCIEYANQMLNIVGHDNMIIIEGGSTSIAKADPSLKELKLFAKRDTDLVLIKDHDHQLTQQQIETIGNKLTILGDQVKQYISEKFSNKLEINVSKNKKILFQRIEKCKTKIIETDKSGDKMTAIVGNIQRSNNEYFINPVDITNKKIFKLLRYKVTFYNEKLNMTIFPEVLDISQPLIEYGGCQLENKEWIKIKQYFNNDNKYITTPENDKILIPKTIIKIKDYTRMLRTDYDRTMSNSKRQQLQIRNNAMRKSMSTSQPKEWINCKEKECNNIINRKLTSNSYCKQHICDIV